ncbi:MAG: hypothetical protein MPJ50_03240 [Pirellulales bacterium]|nr:hypothetical protein [Pirellulales bacterium]
MTIAIMKNLTPVLSVNNIEDSLPFWTERLKFTKTIEAPGENGLNFCALQRGDVEVMLQTKASIKDDLPQVAALGFQGGGVMLFVKVEDLEEIISAVEGCEIIVPDRTTFYGMREIGVRAPGGCVILFAQRVGEEDG